MMTLSKDFIREITDSLTQMRDYADDGMLDRDDPDYQDFFEALDNADAVLEKLNRIIEEGGK